ncbi:MAG: glycosyltransferase [Aeromicrobium sp.]
MLHTVDRDPSASASRALRVASVPSSHVYVRHLSPDVDDVLPAVERLADPPPTDGPAEQSRWWPPAMLEAGWVADHADEFDVFHLHFGFDARTPRELQDVVDALRAAGRPLVFTVHDLRNPHHVDRAPHDAQLDVLIPAADRVVTLTDGAAQEIERRWGRTAVVVPHPHVVDLDIAAGIRNARAGRTGPFRVGLHVKSLRACMDAEAILPGLVRAVRELPDAVLQVDGHRDVLEPGGARFDARLAGMLADLGDAVDLRVHDFFSDDELWMYLGSLDVSVLPYRHGTHSGWLEACRDLGTDVVAPTCGHYADQAPVHSYLLDESTYDEDSLVAAVREAHDRPSPAVDLGERLRQRRAVAQAHRDLYARLVRS